MATKLPLVWADGRPMIRAQLTQEIAGPETMGVRQILSGHPAKGLTPQRLANLLLAAEAGDAIGYLELAEEMEEKDLHYLSVLGTRKRQVAQLPIEVVPAGDSEEEQADAQLVRDWLDRDMLESELFDILDAIGKGYSATEIVWEFTADAWLPASLKWRDPRFFEFDRVTGERLMLRDVGPPVELSAAKFIVHYHPAKSGLPIRSGLARVAAWSYMFKNYAIKDWVAFLETYGMPMRVGRYDNGETEPNIRKLMGAIADLGSDAAAVFPKSMDVEFIDSKAGTAPEGLWERKARYCDEQVSKVVLGQTGTTDSKSGGLGDGGNKVHDRVAGDIERADAKVVAATLNRDLVIPLVMLNRGPRRRYPRIRIGHPEQVDVVGLVDAVERLVPLGVEVSADDIRDRAGLPAPEPGTRLLQAPAAAPPAAPPAPVDAPPAPVGPVMPESAATAFLALLKPPHGAIGSVASPRRRDPIDDAGDEALGDWEELMVPIIAPIEALMNDARTLEDVRAGLASAIGAMDDAAFVELLARAAFGARMAGDIDARPDDVA